MMTWRLSIAARMARRLVVTQSLVAVKLGKSLRFTLAEIEAFIQQSRQGPRANA